MNSLLQKILKKVTPTEEEHQKEKKLVKEIFQQLKKFSQVEPLLVGSLAKKTDLRGEKDIDIFIKFPKNVPREELEEEGLAIGKKIFQKLKANYEIDYAEHPYVIGSYQGYDIEIVPCYEVKGKPLSSVDRTPSHTAYIKKKLEKDPILRDEIRLLKKFMQGSKVYGAEEKIQGFSGYLAELLVISYGSFLNVLKKARKWKLPQILDPENLWKKEDKEALKYYFSEADLIVVDPVDKDRNVAAAVSAQKLSEFIMAARNFLEKPEEKFFFPLKRKPLSQEALKKRISTRETKLIAILFSHPKLNLNALYSQLRKTKKTILEQIKNKNFKVLKSAEWSNERNISLLIFEFEAWVLPQVELWPGPPLDASPEEQDKFLEKYKKAYIKGKRLMAERKRKFKKIRPLIQEILKERKGFGKKLKEMKAEILSDQQLIKKLAREKDFLLFLEDFLKPV